MPPAPASPLTVRAELVVLWFFDSRLSADRADLPFGEDSLRMIAWIDVKGATLSGRPYRAEDSCSTLTGPPRRNLEGSPLATRRGSAGE